MIAFMLTTPAPSSLISDAQLVRARSKVLAREDREMKAKLVRLRRDSDLTQKQVADMIGISQQAIYKFERYDSDPKLSTLRRYANAVGALIEHNVVPDTGQSKHLASTPRWEAAAEVRNRRVRTNTATLVSGSWGNSKRTDFALAR